jgi:adenylate cyclase
MSALFILQVSDKFGQGVLISFLLGKYYRPKEDDRIFMFMDLKSSTTSAEKLGHIKYSQFIQDCFFDITDVITKYDAKIYQYVGDELENQPHFEFSSLGDVILKGKAKSLNLYAVNPV